MLAKNITQHEGGFNATGNAMGLQYNLETKNIQITGMNDILLFLQLE